MKLNVLSKKWAFVPAVCMWAAVISCEKKPAETVLHESFSGSLKITSQPAMPAYVKPGETYLLIPGGVNRKDEGDFGYYWLQSSSKTVRDTTRHEGDPDAVTGAYSYTVPDTLGNLAISCSAFAKGYYTTTKSLDFTVVNSKSLTDTGMADPEIMTFIDGSQEYAYVTIGALDWLVSNLVCGKGKAYADSPVMKNILGSYLTWNEAITACPAGWRLPSGADWAALCSQPSGTGADAVFNGAAGSLMVDARFNGERMWPFAKDVKITNSTGLRALPAGFYNGDKFDGFLKYAAFWTSDEKDGKAIYRYIHYGNANVYANGADKDSFAMPVRCVR